MCILPTNNNNNNNNNNNWLKGSYGRWSWTSKALANYRNVDTPTHQSPGWHLWQVPATP